MTFQELVRASARKHAGRALTDEEVELVLWSFTCFPFGHLKIVVRQLKEHFTGLGGSDNG